MSGIVGNPVLIHGKDPAGNDLPLKVDAQGALEMAGAAVSTTNEALTQVAASLSSTLVLAPNATRAGFSLFNDSNQNVLVRFAPTASLSSWSVSIRPQWLYEAPAAPWLGAVSAIWVPFDLGFGPLSGNLQVAERTP